MPALIVGVEEVVEFEPKGDLFIQAIVCAEVEVEEGTPANNGFAFIAHGRRPKDVKLSCNCQFLFMNVRSVHF